MTDFAATRAAFHLPEGVTRSEQQPADGVGHRLGVGRRGQHHLDPAEPLQRLADITGLGVDVMVRP